MIVNERELNGNIVVGIETDSSKGDRLRVFERNHDPKDVPVVVVYSLGSDYQFRTEQEKRDRVLALVKMLGTAINDAVADLGKVAGLKMRSPFGQGS